MRLCNDQYSGKNNSQLFEEYFPHSIFTSFIIGDTIYPGNAQPRPGETVYGIIEQIQEQSNPTTHKNTNENHLHSHCW